VAACSEVRRPSGGATVSVTAPNRASTSKSARIACRAPSHTGTGTLKFIDHGVEREAPDCVVVAL
jgi:hypothetical protein